MMKTQKQNVASRFIGVIKIFLLSALVAGLVIPSAIGQAAEVQYAPISFDEAFGGKYGVPLGNWYDSEGKLTLSIERNGTINGYKVISVGFMGDSIADYKVTLSTEDGAGVIYLTHFGEDYHDTLILNKKTALRPTKNPRYVESVGGVYLGMNKNQLVSLYGSPSVTGEEGRNEAWTYNREGFRVCFDRLTSSIISSITIFPNGDRRFDSTGLSASVSLDTLIARYNAKPYVRMYSIGHGEGFYKRDGNVTLFALGGY